MTNASAKQKAWAWVVPIVLSILGGGSVVLINPQGWENRDLPYTSVNAERDTAQMKQWIIEYVKDNVPPPEVSMQLEMLSHSITLLNGSIDRLDRKLDSHHEVHQNGS